MTDPTPRIEIDLVKLLHNASTLVTRLGERGISVTGITKAGLGSPDIAEVMLRAGVTGIGDSRIENINNLVDAGIDTSFVLTRSPKLSETDEVVRYADISLNSELRVIAQLSSSATAAGCKHGILLMVEMGDLREGMMPADLLQAARSVINLPNIYLQGIGCNLACYGGVVPDRHKMASLSKIATKLEKETGIRLNTVSGGNSANLDWALGTGRVGRINNLRLGEAILLGRETLHRQAIEGLHTDVFSLVAEVIESKVKPSRPQGTIAQTAFGTAETPADRGDIHRCILAIGRQDCDPEGLIPPPGITILGASSDHLIVESLGGEYPVGSEIAFQLNYSALLRVMTSPYVMHSLNPLQKPSILHTLRAGSRLLH